jgi:rhomboid protease GluP
VVTVVSILQFIIFIIELIVGGAKYDGAFVKGNDMGGPSAETLCNMGGKWEPAIRNGAVWRLLTPIVLHAGIIHIAGNMFFQLRFGYVTEQRWGRWRWLGLYILAGVMASLWSTVLGPKSVSVGASGALFGIIGADMTYLAYNWVQIPHNRQEAFFLGFVVIINFLLGMGSGIDNYAHLGGLMGGLFLGILIPPHLEKRPAELWIRIGAGVGFAALALLFMLLIWSANPWPDSYMYYTNC